MLDNGSTKWQARFKADGYWIRSTTKEKDLNGAKNAACEMYLEAQYRLTFGIPAQSVARLAVDRLEKAIASGEGRSVYRDYIQAIDNYLIPFLATTTLTTSRILSFKSLPRGGSRNWVVRR